MPSDETIKKLLRSSLERNRKIVKATRKFIEYHKRVSFKCTGDEKEAHKIALRNALNNNVEYFNIRVLTGGFDDIESVKRYYNIYLKQAKITIAARRRVEDLDKSNK